MSELTYLDQLGIQAKDAAKVLNSLSTERKNEALLRIAERLEDSSSVEQILEGNKEDLILAQQNGMSAGMIDRLTLTKERISSMAEGIRQVAALEDPNGEILYDCVRPNGIHIVQQRVPFGIVGIIFESRPNVTADAFALCFKTGNVCILRGGRDCLKSNLKIVEVIQNTLSELGLPVFCVQLFTDTSHETAEAFMKRNDFLDLLIPRGGAGLIQTVVRNSTVPVIETGTGNCHVYVDRDADLQMAADIVFNAKTQRISVCNACESLLIHESIADRFLPILMKKLEEKPVELRLDQFAMNIAGKQNSSLVIREASEEDWGTEYLDYILSVKTVSDVTQAVDHINRYNTRHSDCIVTENAQTAEAFLNGVDSACVYWNASTRFTDGFEFGFGAEIGISTQKLHARGPMGLKELTTYKYRIIGNGQVRQ